MEKVYTVRSKNSGTVVQYTYKAGILSGVNILNDNVQYNVAEKVFTKTLYGLEEEFLEFLQKHSAVFELNERHPTFEDFWSKWLKKVKKVEAEKQWKKLSIAEQIQAYNYLSQYNRRKMQNGEYIQNPDSWLRQRVFMDNK